MKRTINLPLPTFRQVADCSGAELLALGARAQAGEIILTGMESGAPMRPVRWTWRVSFEIIKPTAKEPAKPKVEVQSEMF